MVKHNWQKLLFATIVTLGFSLLSCTKSSNSHKHKVVSLNFSDTIRVDQIGVPTENQKEALRIAISAISSPRETFNYYKDMLMYIEEQLGQKVIMIQRKTYSEINDLIKENKADIAIVCSGNYVYGKADSAFKLLVVPEWKGKNYYNTYIIAHKNSGIKSINDLKNKRFAFTDPLSTSGKLYPTKRVNELGSTPNDFFESVVYTHAHDNSVQLVAKHIVDGASVNSLVFDYLATSSPNRVKDIVIIEKSAPHAMPPVVVSNLMSKEMEAKLKDIFLNMHKNQGSKKALQSLMVDRYTHNSDTIYNSVRELAGITPK